MGNCPYRINQNFDFSIWVSLLFIYILHFWGKWALSGSQGQQNIKNPIDIMPDFGPSLVYRAFKYDTWPKT